MPVLRFLWNVILAVLLTVLIVLVLGTALGIIAARGWETAGLDDGRAESTWLWVDGSPIYYQVQGSEEGPVVVLVHGDGVEGSVTWAQNTSSLVRSGMRVITVDLRGHGRSERSVEPVYSVRQQAELLATVLNNLQVSDALVVAHDLGSAVALQMALDQPQFVQQLALIAPRLEREDVTLWEWAQKVPYLRQAALWARWGGGPLLALERKAQFADRGTVTDEYVTAVRNVTRIEGTMAALEARATQPSDSDLPDGLEQVGVPVLVLLGDSDPVASESAVRAWASRLPAATVEVIEDAGHYPHVEQSSAVNQRLAVLVAGDGTP